MCVANFAFNYLRHFFINFENCCTHFAANFLNFLKHPQHFQFEWFWRILGTKTQKIKKCENMPIWANPEISPFLRMRFINFFSIPCPRCLRRPCISKILASWKLNSWKAKEKTIVLFNVRVNNSVSVGKTAETLKFLNRFTPAQSGNWFCNIFHFSGVYFCLQKPFCPAGKWHKTSWDIVVLTSNFSLTIS